MYSLIADMLSLSEERVHTRLCQGDIGSMAEHLKFYFDVLFPKRAQVPLGMHGKWAICIYVFSKV